MSSSHTLPPSLLPFLPHPCLPYRDVQKRLLGEVRVQGRGEEPVIPPGIYLVLNVQDGRVILGGGGRRGGGREGGTGW